MSKACFISYSKNDTHVAEKVCKLFEQQGLNCWIAPRDVPPGVDFDRAIIDAIEKSNAMLLILSTHANESKFVKNEVNRAFTYGKTIFTLRTDDIIPSKSLELYLATNQWTDAFPPPLEEKVLRLADAIKAYLEELSQSHPRIESHSTTPTIMRSFKPPPDEAVVLFQLGAYLYQKAKYNEAIKELTDAIQIHTDFPAALTLRGSCYTTKKEYDKAISDFTTAIRINSTNNIAAITYNERGKAYARLDKYEKGIDDCTIAIKLRPNYASAYIDRGVIYFWKTEYENALNDFNKAIELNPSETKAYIGRAGIYRDKGEYEKAKSDYETAKKLDPAFKIPESFFHTDDSKSQARLDEALGRVLHIILPIRRLDMLPPLEKAKALMAMSPNKKTQEDLEYLNKYLKEGHPSYEIVKKFSDTYYRCFKEWIS